MKHLLPTLLLSAACLCLSAEGAADDRPNVVLMMADDLGWGDTGYNGHPVLKTPHLDAMARSGLRLNRFYAAAPVCSPTRGSCLTGRHPYRYGVFFANTGHLRQGEQSLAELLQAAGYRTGHFGKWHLGTLTKTQPDANRGGPKNAAHFAPPEQHGFDVNFSTESKVPTWDPLLRPQGESSRTHWNAVDNGQPTTPYGTAYWSRGRAVTENIRGDDSRVIMDRAIPFLQQSVREQKPFFAVIWFHAPHLPVVAGPEYAAMYEGSSYERNYWGCITAMDEQVGRLRAALKEAGAADNTIVCFCSDNGPEGQAGKAPGTAGPLRGRKRDLYEGGIRVPGILEWPARIRPGSVSEMPACTSDYLPTTLAAAGIDPPAARALDGVNLLPLIGDGSRRADRGRAIGFQSGRMAVWIEDRLKLVGVQSSPQKKKRGRDEAPMNFALYDLVADPQEKNDLAKKQPDEVGRMAAALAKWQAECRVSLEGGDYAVE